MRQSVGLLAREDKAALFGARKCGFAVPVVYLMPFAFRHHLGRAMESLFSLDHIARGEPIHAAPVLAQFDQVGRAAHRAHDLVELLDAVAVPMREHRHVTVREGRLLLRDRIQRHRRIGDDARAIVARNLAVHVRAVSGFDTFTLDPLRGCADLCLRLQLDALRLKAAMVDPCVDVEFGQALVDVLGPTFAPPFHHLGLLRQLNATLAAMKRNRAARNRHRAAQARHDLRRADLDRRKTPKRSE